MLRGNEGKIFLKLAMRGTTYPFPTEHFFSWGKKTTGYRQFRHSADFSLVNEWSKLDPIQYKIMFAAN